MDGRSISVPVKDQLYEGEIFLPIRGFEDCYAVSDQGRVLSIRSGKILKSPLNNNGYPRVGLFDSKRGKFRNVDVHVLVLETFRGPRPAKGYTGHHCDADKSNNRLDNLIWCTQKENIGYAAALGRMGKIKKLSSEQLIRAKQMREEGMSYMQIAKKLEVSEHEVFMRLHYGY